MRSSTKVFFFSDITDWKMDDVEDRFNQRYKNFTLYFFS